MFQQVPAKNWLEIIVLLDSHETFFFNNFSRNGFILPCIIVGARGNSPPWTANLLRAVAAAFPSFSFLCRLACPVQWECWVGGWTCD